VNLVPNFQFLHLQFTLQVGRVLELGVVLMYRVAQKIGTIFIRLNFTKY